MQATKIRAFTEIEGGGSGAMDAVSCNDLATNDLALAYDVNSDTNYFYSYNNDDSCEADDSPWTIAPDDCSTCSNKGQWEAMTGFGFGPSSTPTDSYYDLEAADFDAIVQKAVDCSATGSGAEDCGYQIKIMRNGSLQVVEDIGDNDTENYKRFYEYTSNGDNYVELKALVNYSGNKTITLPDATGTVALTNADQDLWQCFTVLAGAFDADGTNCSDPASVAMGNTGSYPTGIATADDGTFDEASEDFTCSTSGYDEGSNTLYVECDDNSDNWSTGNSLTVNYSIPTTITTRGGRGGGSSRQ